MMELLNLLEDALGFVTTWEAFLLGATVVGVGILVIYLVSYLVDRFKRKRSLIYEEITNE